MHFTSSRERWPSRCDPISAYRKTTLYQTLLQLSGITRSPTRTSKCSVRPHAKARTTRNFAGFPRSRQDCTLQRHGRRRLIEDTCICATASKAEAHVLPASSAALHSNSDNAIRTGSAEAGFPSTQRLDNSVGERKRAVALGKHQTSTRCPLVTHLQTIPGVLQMERMFHICHAGQSRIRRNMPHAHATGRRFIGIQ